MANKFEMRTTKPAAGNKYYIRKVNGGYSPAIKGSPADSECDVLSNCVGYAIGRFNEIGGWGSCKYLSSVNAENFIQYKGTELEVGQAPRLGACMVWQKGATLNGADGAGHVAIVEKVINDTEVYTSESAYGGTAFRNATRKKGSDGKWGMGSDYKFLGFIYNPAPCCSDDAKADNSGGSTVTDTSLTFKVGDVVQFTGGIHYSSAGAANGPSCKPGKAKVTATSKGSKHPYHLIHTDSTSTVYGWVDADKVQAVAEGSNSSSTDIKVGDVVQFAGGPHYISSTAASSSSSPKAGPAKVTAISKGSKHPYHIVHTDGQSSVYGWVDAGKVSK